MAERLPVTGSVWGIHDSVGDPPPLPGFGGLRRAETLPVDGQPSGCGYYRIIAPLDELARQGWTVGYQAGRPPPDSDTYRIIVAQRTDKYDALPDWRRLRARHRLVYEIDDDIFTVDRLNWQAHGVYSRLETQEAVVHAAQVADMVTVTTPVLAEVMRDRTGHTGVRVLPNCIPTALLTMERRRNRRKMVVGWAGGASHAGDVAMVADPVREFLARTKRAELHVVGTDYRKTFGVAGRFTDWVPVDASLAYYRGIDFDVALCPLTGTRFDASKCVDSSMRICTDRGVVEAGSLEPGMKVWHGGWRKIEATRRDTPRPGLLITTEGGYQLRLTPEHRMMVNGAWTQAGAIAPGDRMAMEPEWTGVTDPVRVPWPADSRMGRAGLWNSSRVPADPDAFLTASDGPRLDISPRWGRFLGAFAGDGSCGQATMIQISCDGQDQDWIDLLMDDLRAFGLNPTTEQITTFDGTVLRRRGVRVASAHLLRVLASLGVTKPRESGKPIRVPCVPEVIWRSPREVIAEFLAGYFECDGHCSGNGVSAVSKSEQLIRDVQRLLLLFGITSVVKSRLHRAQNGYSGGYWHVTLRRAEADVFAKEVGFRSERKRARLASITDKPHSLSSFHPMDWSRAVESVTPCMVTPIDIQVEGQVFAAAGFTSHNSSIKALEAAALGIPTIASDCEAYRGFVVDGESGFLCKTPGQFGERLAELAADPGLREAMGARARDIAAGHTIEGNWQRWADAYASLL